MIPSLAVVSTEASRKSCCREETSEDRHRGSSDACRIFASKVQMDAAAEVVALRRT